MQEEGVRKSYAVVVGAVSQDVLVERDGGSVVTFLIGDDDYSADLSFVGPGVIG